MLTKKEYRRKKRIMRAFKLNEISAVDEPAQTPARMAIFKRDDEAEKALGLANVLTSSDNGHQHGVHISVHEGDEPYLYVSHASGPDEEGHGHSHELVRNSDGTLTLSENEGHTHTIDADVMQQALMNMMIGKVEETPGDPGESADDLGNQPKEKDEMAEKNADTVSAELQKSQDTVAKLQAVVDLSSEHRAHYDSLSVSKRKSFLELSDEDKSAAVEATLKSNPVIYTAEDGTEYRKSDDSRLIKMAQERDDDHKEVAKLRVEAEQASFEKKADDLLDLVPGERIEKIALVRAVAKIEDEETRGKVEKLLGAANRVYKMALTTVGVNTPQDPENPSATDLLEKKVKEEKERDSSLNDTQALNKVLDTSEGQILYGKYQAERRVKAQLGN